MPILWYFGSCGCSVELDFWSLCGSDPNCSPPCEDPSSGSGGRYPSSFSLHPSPYLGSPPCAKGPFLSLNKCALDINRVHLVLSGSLVARVYHDTHLVRVLCGGPPPRVPVLSLQIGLGGLMGSFMRASRRARACGWNHIWSQKVLRLLFISLI